MNHEVREPRACLADGLLDHVSVPSTFDGNYHLVNVYITMDKSPCLMGKSTISTGPFSIAMLVYQRVYTCN